MTATLDRVPLSEITARAREVRPGRTALSVIAGVLFGMGWLIAKALGAAWLALAWSVTAMMLGFQSGGGRQPRIPRGDIEAENARLRSEVQRLSGG